MEVHKVLGMGFKEVIYKDALELEFQTYKIPYVREKKYAVEYKGVVLPRRFYADFIVFGSIVLEVKASSMIVQNHFSQSLNYLKASGLRLAIIANFGERSFTSKRIIL